MKFGRKRNVTETQTQKRPVAWVVLIVMPQSRLAVVAKMKTCELWAGVTKSVPRHPPSKTHCRMKLLFVNMWYC